MALSMTCPKCDGDIEYEVERGDSGDGVWAMSYLVATVLYDEVADGEGGSWCRTACGCQWTEGEIEGLEERANELAHEVSEP